MLGDGDKAFADLEPANVPKRLGEALLLGDLVNISDIGTGDATVHGVLVGPGPERPESPDDGEPILLGQLCQAEHRGVFSQVHAELDPVGAHAATSAMRAA